MTPEETERTLSLVKKLGEFSGKKVPQIAKFADLVPLLKNLADLGSDRSKGSKIAKFANHSSYGRSRNNWTLQCKINFN